MASGILAAVREDTARIFESTGGDPAQIQRHLDFQGLVAQLAADLIDLPVEDIDARVVRALERIARFGGEQRGWLSVIDARGRRRPLYEWYEEGLEPLAANVGKLDASPWAVAQLSAGESLRIRSLDDLAPEAGTERGLYEYLGLRSALIVPIRSPDRELLGAALFVSHDREGTWPENFRPLCSIVGDMLRGALLRYREHVELRRSEARLRCLLSAGMLGILTARRDGTIIEANDAALSVTGYDRAAMEAGEMHWDRMTPPEYRHLTTAALDQFERAGHCPPWEQDFYRRDGSRVPALLGLAAVHNDPGTFLVFALDVTARKRAESELTERKRLTRLITGVSTRFIGMDADRIDQAIGDALREVAGVVGLGRCSVWQFPPGGGGDAELTHRWDRKHQTALGSALPHVHIPPLPRWISAFARHEFILIRDGGRDLPEDSPERRFLEERGVRSALAVPLVQRDNVIGFVTFVCERDEEEWSQSRVALLRIVGEIIGAALERRHGGERRRKARTELEERFTARTSQLEAANRELEAFSHAVSHDLRAPLRGVGGFSRILVEDHSAGLPEQARAILERIRATCQRMDGLIDALLALSRIARSQPKRESVDFSAMAATLCESLRESDPSRTVTFVVEPSLVVDGEPRLLRVLLDNLLGNSWKFTSTHAAARIQLGSRHENGARVLYVRDDGVGFDSSQAERIFKPFQRLHTPGLFEGYGVGLATVQRIVGVHGGRVWAEGEPEAGATIYFTLDPAPEGGPDPDGVDSARVG
ncbi:MAG: GAF domain-containing protein [Deltaproteobacteria bacterium]|nr:GAF domain-containing protein [Deltaproteobacteria bacterium]